MCDPPPVCWQIPPQLQWMRVVVVTCTTRGSSACHLCKCNKNLHCKQVAVTACTTVGFVCLFFNRKQTSTVNASVGHCMKDRWPPPLVRSQFQKELAVDVVRSSAMESLCPTKSMQVSSHVVCSQFHKEFAVDVGCYHFLYDPGPEPPLSILQLKENFKVNVSVIASTTRGFSALFSTTHTAVIACTPRGCTTRGSHACLLCNSKNTCSASRLLSTGCCGTACLTRELCLTVLQWKQTSTVNVRAGHCMYAPWPPSIVFSPTPKRFWVHEGCCHIGPRPWAPSLSVLQLKSAGASVIACTTRGSSACLLCNSKEYLQCKQMIVTACTTRGLCFPVLRLKANSVQRWKQAPNLQWV